MTRSLIILLTVLAVCSLACATPKRLNKMPGADRVRIYTSDPPEDLEIVADIEVQDGSGCGAFGTRGTFERARLRLRNQVIAHGGTAARIDETVKPHITGDCYDNRYIIRGTIFRKRE